ncbi:MAG: hypothetical protein HY272_01865 [Gammaproteobacteria bacterium]|nr:hypothetical protein [Gammaproteobacteria bacterium]
MSKTKQSTTPAPAANIALAHDDEARIIAKRVLALQDQVQCNLPVAEGRPLHGEALNAWLEREELQEDFGKVGRGIGYLLKKKELGHGAFMGWIEDRGRSYRSVNEDIKVASMLVHLSEANMRRAATLPQRKLAALASAPAPMIDDLFASGALDEAAVMNREELRELINLRQQLEKKAAKEAELREVIAEQDEALRRRQLLPETNQHVLELRRAVLDETEALRANAHTLQSVMERVALLPLDLPRAEFDAIVHPLMYALQGLHATASALFAHGFDRFADYHADIDVLPPQLAEEDAARGQRQYQSFMAIAEQRAKHRQIDLSLQPRRGRPRKQQG